MDISSQDAVSIKKVFDTLGDRHGSRLDRVLKTEDFWELIKKEKMRLSIDLLQAFNNFYNYLRDTTSSEQQCGECSYQQSCGRKCHRRCVSKTISKFSSATVSSGDSENFWNIHKNRKTILQRWHRNNQPTVCRRTKMHGCWPEHGTVHFQWFHWSFSNFQACVSTFMPDCKLWPNPAVQLPNVTESMSAIINNLDYLQCVPEHR